MSLRNYGSEIESWGNEIAGLGRCIHDETWVNLQIDELQTVIDHASKVIEAAVYMRDKLENKVEENA